MWRSVFRCNVTSLFHPNFEAFLSDARCAPAGVKRINSGVYTESGEALKAWLKLIVGDIRLLVEHGRRMTVTVNDVLIALKRRGRCVDTC